MSKVWFITGSSRGLGRSLAEAVLDTGDQVVATARKPEVLKDLVDQFPGQIKIIRLDVTKVRKSIQIAWEGGRLSRYPLFYQSNI